MSVKKWPIARLILLFGIFLLSAIGFVALADEVLDRDTMPFDVAVLQALNNQAAPFWDTFFLTVTHTGGVAGVLIITVGILVYLIMRKRYQKALILAASVGGAAIINSVLKLIFERSRPDLWEQLVTETSFSFPSGHAMASSALALSIIVILWGTRYRYVACVIGFLYVLLVGLSRLYLGVHYPSDVIAGWLVSTAWVIAVTVLIKEWRLKRKKSAESSQPDPTAS